MRNFVTSRKKIYEQNITKIIRKIKTDKETITTRTTTVKVTSITHLPVESRLQQHL